MPWVTDKQGNRDYKLSLFAKEELPTWGEVYEEFWKYQQFFYDPKDADMQKEDLYWKIPHRKYLIAIVCNQFNKMIFEDKFNYHNINIDYNGEKCEITDIRFTCVIPSEEDGSIDDYKNWYNSIFCGTSCQPPIYTIPLPTGKGNPFIVNTYPRINVNDIGYMQLIPVVSFNTSTERNMLYILYPYEEEYMIVMEEFIKQYKEYFDEPVGWKNEDSRKSIIIGSELTSHCK